MEQTNFEKMLFVSDSNKYGDKYIEHLLEQYKIYIEAAEKVSDRRQKANEFFLALNTAVVTVVGGLIASEVLQERLVWFVAPAFLAGITMCYFWYSTVRAYKNLNSAKFKVVHMIERRMPIALYDTEWELVGRGQRNDLYEPFTHIEIKVPWIFMSLYALLCLSVVPWNVL